MPSKTSKPSSKSSGSNTVPKKTTSKTSKSSTKKTTSSETAVSVVSEPTAVAASSVPAAVAAATTAVAEPTVAASSSVPASTVAEPTGETLTSEELTSEELTSDGIEAEFLSLSTRLQELKNMQIAVVSDLKKLHKNVQKHMKDSNKKRRNKKLADPNRPKRAPSGFAKPTVISTELCNFLGKPEGTEMARTEVTKFLTQYISEHKLQDQANRRKILPDKPLQKLLNADSNDEVTYFNLQKYMKVHFPKSKVIST
jgi:upstream activation factor subunit UAF30